MSAPLKLTSITNEHMVPINLLCQQLNTNVIRGMSDKHAKCILKEKGKNKFLQPRRPRSTELKEFFRSSSTEKYDSFSKSEWKRLFGNQLPSDVTVIRDGVRKGILCKHLVAGDIVELKRNDIVPADIRIIYANDVIVDNRLITGRSRELRSHRLASSSNDCLLSPNMIFACTKILQGECVGVVLRTGDETVFGTLKNYATKVKVAKDVLRKHSLE